MCYIYNQASFYPSFLGCRLPASSFINLSYDSTLLTTYIDLAFTRGLDVHLSSSSLYIKVKAALAGVSIHCARRGRSAKQQLLLRWRKCYRALLEVSRTAATPRRERRRSPRDGAMTTGMTFSFRCLNALLPQGSKLGMGTLNRVLYGKPADHGYSFQVLSQRFRRLRHIQVSCCPRTSRPQPTTPDGQF